MGNSTSKPPQDASGDKNDLADRQSPNTGPRNAGFQTPAPTLEELRARYHGIDGFVPGTFSPDQAAHYMLQHPQSHFIYQMPNQPNLPGPRSVSFDQERPSVMMYSANGFGFGNSLGAQSGAIPPAPVPKDVSKPTDPTPPVATDQEADNEDDPPYDPADDSEDEDDDNVVDVTPTPTPQASLDSQAKELVVKASARRFGRNKSIYDAREGIGRTARIFYAPWKVESEVMYTYPVTVMTSSAPPANKHGVSLKVFMFHFIWADTRIRMAQFLAYIRIKHGPNENLSPAELHRAFQEFVRDSYRFFKWDVHVSVPKLVDPGVAASPGLPEIKSDTPISEVFGPKFEKGRVLSPSNKRRRSS